MSIQEIYARHRVLHGILDSIRFTATDTGRTALDVSQSLGLADYYLEHRS